MLRYIVRRMIAFVPMMIAVSLVSFILLYLIPGDAAALLAPPGASGDFVKEIRTYLRLDDPLYLQYLRYLGGLVQGDLGRSYITNRGVLEELWPRYLATMQLALASMVISIPIGLGLGILAAIKQGSILDSLLTIASVFGLSMPAFWLGLMLIIIFSLGLGWFPSGGQEGAGSIVLPAVTLSTWSIAIIARMTRASMLEVLGAEYVRVARGKGLSELIVIYRHALMNAMIPIITVIGLRFGYMLSGAIITETVFAWPGMGRFVVQSILSRDYPNIRGAILLFAVSFMFVNLLTDLLYFFVDPRIRFEES